MGILIFMGKVVVSLMLMLLVMVPTMYGVYRWGTYLSSEPKAKQPRRTQRPVQRTTPQPNRFAQPRNYNQNRNRRITPADELRQRRYEQMHAHDDDMRRKKMG